MQKILLITGLFLLCSGFSIAENDQERILNFKVKLELLESGIIEVTEEIKIYTAGKRIQRGIYRGLPTFNSKANGITIPAELKIKHILRDGKNEPYSIDFHKGESIIYIGNPNYFLENGYYTYTIHYQVSNQVRFFDNFDEIYWNVTGNYWEFDIDSASVALVLPENIRLIPDQIAYYTGPTEATFRDAQIVDQQSNRIVIEMTKNLQSYEGFTIAVAFEKGVINKPDLRSSISKTIGRNYGLYILVFVLFFYVYTKLQVGKSAPPQPLKHRSTAPEGISPAFARYVIHRDADQRAITANYISMAVKGFIKISKKKEEYTLSKIGEAEDQLSPEELAFAKELFASGPTVKLNDEVYSKKMKAISAFKKSLNETNDNQYFTTNRKPWWIGVISIMLGYFVVLAFVPYGYHINTAFTILWYSPWLILSFYLLFNSYKLYKLDKPSKALFQFIIGFLSVCGAFYVGFISGSIEWDLSFYLFFGAAICSTYSRILVVITEKGQALLAEINSFKYYLHHVQQSGRADQSEFEAFLPYAIALDVEKNWANQFESTNASNQKRESNQRIFPIWYHDNSGMGFNATELSRDISRSFSSSVNSSSTSSSSGSSGGGSSGGGSGGGGGGGW